MGEDIWVVVWVVEGEDIGRRGYLGGSFRAEGEDIWVSVLGLGHSSLNFVDF